MALAACRGLGSDAFVTFGRDAIAAALATCAECPVRVECDDDTRANRCLGVWGGVERRRLVEDEMSTTRRPPGS